MYSINNSIILNIVTTIDFVTTPNIENNKKLIGSDNICGSDNSCPLISSLDIIRDLALTPFTRKESVESFYLFQEEIKKDKFFIGRLSGNETLFTGYIKNKLQIPNLLFQTMLFGAGIQFKTMDDVHKYVDLYDKSILNSSLLCIWDGSMYNQSKLYLDQLTDKRKISACALDPYYFMDEPQYKLPQLLKNKKILIITSHNKTTELQINKVDTLFNKPIFDNNTFYIYKPAQQNGGSHDTNTWDYHYELMTHDLINIKRDFDFDLALVSAGGFGMLLCNFIYEKLNASVIYLGGSLQIYFGIMGKRWEMNTCIKKNMNDNWTYPLIEDRPQNINSCEGGCYW
jgi:hypothetical protein